MKINVNTKDKYWALLFLVQIIMSCMLFLCCNFSFNTVKADSNFSGGNGLETSPYIIDSADDLGKIAFDITEGKVDGYYGKYFRLNRSIDIGTKCLSIDGIKGWSPIGTAMYPFKGFFDGNNYTVSGLKIFRPDEDRVGLFGETNDDAEIKNLAVSGEAVGKSYSAGLVGYNKGLIKNCFNQTAVSDEILENAMQLGGIAGYNAGVIEDCGNSGIISASFNISGGIAGDNLGQIKNCYNKGVVTSKNSIVGGIVGNNGVGATIEGVFNTGLISGDTAVGGIAGTNGAVIANAYNTNSIASNRGTAGGICGSNETAGDIKNTFSAANVIGKNNIAALCGYNFGIISNSYFNKNVFLGEIANYGVVINSAGLADFDMTQEDTLTHEDKMGNLGTEAGENFWSKRAYEGLYSYYPELTWFYENSVERLKNESEAGARLKRRALTADEISLEKDSFVYNGLGHEPKIYLSDLKLVKGLDYTCVYSDNIDYGTAKVDIIFINFYSGEVVKEFAITKPQITIAWSNESLYYNGAVQHPTAIVTDGTVDGEDITLEYKFEGCVNAGDYAIKAVLKDTAINGNYELANPDFFFKIAKKKVTVTWDKTTLIYDGTAQYNKIESVVGKIGEEDVTFIYDIPGNISAGTHSVTADLQVTEINANYEFAGQTHTYQIEKRPITVAWENTRFFYNGKVQYPNAEVDTGRVGLQDITFIYSGFEKNIDANEVSGHFVELSLKNTDVNANYFFEPQKHKYYIYKNQIKITWWEDTLYYNGKPQHQNFYISEGRIGLDKIIFDISDYSKNINAAENKAYVITVSLAADELNSNYCFIPVSKTYGISKAKFNINGVNFSSQTYTFDGTSKSLLVFGELPIGITVTYENNDKILVGNYVVKAIFHLDLDNFEPLSVNVLTATLYIAEVCFVAESGGIELEITEGKVPFGTTANFTNSFDKTTFKKSGGKILKAGGLSFSKDGTKIVIDGKLKISIKLNEKEFKKSGIKVFYINSFNELERTEYIIEGDNIVFNAVDCVQFALVYEEDNYLIWWILGASGFLLLIAVFIIFRKKIFCMAHVKTTGIKITEKVNTATDNLSLGMTEVETTDNKLAADDCVKCYDFLNLEENKEQLGEVEKEFTIDGIFCKSYSWFKKGLNFKNPIKQKSVCSGDKIIVKLYESTPKNFVYWQGHKIRMNSLEYDDLLKKAKELSEVCK